MAEVLFIGMEDMKSLTALGGNVDSDYVIPFIRIAQDMHILSVLGTKLFDKMKELIEDDEMGDAGNEAYNSLLDLIKPCLAHFTMVDYIPFNTYKLKNASTLQPQPENAVPVSKTEMDSLVEIERKTARNYLMRIEEYLCANNSDLPEYTSNTTGDVYPKDPKPFNGLTY